MVPNPSSPCNNNAIGNKDISSTTLSNQQPDRTSNELINQPNITNLSASTKNGDVRLLPPSNLNLRCESERRKTFLNRWTVPFLDPSDLARNGFYYIGFEDIVKCAFCGVEIGFWEEGDDPKLDHQRISPQCQFAKGLPCSNVTASVDETEGCRSENTPSQVSENEQTEQTQGDVCGPGRSSNRPANGYDVCGAWGSPEIRPFSAPERTSLATISCELWKDLENLGVSKTRGPCQPAYGTFDSRLKTFEKWPESHSQKPVKLAEAGFFYTGMCDQTVCFHCGGGLKDWTPEDDPWIEHARWFNKCAFVLVQKGHEFVARVSKNKSTYLNSTNVQELIDVNTTNGDIETCEKAASTAPSHSEVHQPIRKEEATEKKSVEMCVICYNEDRSIVFLPCGHFVACAKCAPSLTKCPVCREPYKGMVRAYLS